MTETLRQRCELAKVQLDRQVAENNRLRYELFETQRQARNEIAVLRAYLNSAEARLEEEESLRIAAEFREFMTNWYANDLREQPF